MLYRLRAILLSVNADGLVRANEEFTAWLRGERTLPFGPHGEHTPVQLLNFEPARNNRCLVATQLAFTAGAHVFLGAGAPSVTRSSRVLLANHREVPAGLVVDEVMGFRRFYESEFSADLPPTLLRCERYLAGAFRRGAEVWPVFSVRALLESPQFMQAAAS